MCLLYWGKHRSSLNPTFIDYQVVASVDVVNDILYHICKRIIVPGPFPWMGGGWRNCLFVYRSSQCFFWRGGVECWCMGPGKSTILSRRLNWSMKFSQPFHLHMYLVTKQTLPATVPAIISLLMLYMEFSLSCTLDFFVRAFSCRHFSLFFMNEQCYVNGPYL